MQTGIVWNSFLRSSLEQIQVVSLTCLIKIYASSSFNNVIDSIGTVAAYLILTCIVWFAVFTPKFLQNRNDQLD